MYINRTLISLFRTQKLVPRWFSLEYSFTVYKSTVQYDVMNEWVVFNTYILSNIIEVQL